MVFNEMDHRLPTVDIVFNCYERTYSHVLTEQFIIKTVNDNHFEFNNVFVVINNVENHLEVENIAQNLKNRKIIDDFFFVKDYIDEVLSIVKLKMKYLGRIHYYTDWALIISHIAKSDYVLHWDANLKLIKSGDWITPSLKEFEKNPQIFTAALYTDIHDEAEELTYEKNNQFFIDFFFSDQLFLVKRKTLLKPIYKYRHICQFIYPQVHIAPTFESMLGGFMFRNNRIRILYKKCTYVHEFGGLYYAKNSIFEKIMKFLQNRILYLYHTIFDYRTNRYRSIKQIILNLKQFFSVLTIKKFLDYRHFNMFRKN